MNVLVHASVCNPFDDPVYVLPEFDDSFAALDAAMWLAGFPLGGRVPIAAAAGPKCPAWELSALGFEAPSAQSSFDPDNIFFINLLTTTSPASTTTATHSTHSPSNQPKHAMPVVDNNPPCACYAKQRARGRLLPCKGRPGLACERCTANRVKCSCK